MGLPIQFLWCNSLEGKPIPTELRAQVDSLKHAIELEHSAMKPRVRHGSASRIALCITFSSYGLPCSPALMMNTTLLTCKSRKCA
jgi:hypothetical protein